MSDKTKMPAAGEFWGCDNEFGGDSFVIRLAGQLMNGTWVAEEVGEGTMKLSTENLLRNYRYLPGRTSFGQEPKPDASYPVRLCKHSGVWMASADNSESAAWRVAVDCLRSLGMDPNDFRTMDKVITGIADRIDGMLNYLSRKNATDAEALQQKIEQLEAFKDYVHNRLTEAGVPESPDPEKTAETGSRIGPRLDLLIASADAARRLVEDCKSIESDYRYCPDEATEVVVRREIVLRMLNSLAAVKESRHGTKPTEEVEDLRCELVRLHRERQQFLESMTGLIAKLGIPTPEEGYRELSKVGWDVRRLSARNAIVLQLAEAAQAVLVAHVTGEDSKVQEKLVELNQTIAAFKESIK